MNLSCSRFPAPCQAPPRACPSTLLSGLLWAALALGALQAADSPPMAGPADHLSDPVAQLVFMAVLEGCLRDGVANEDIDLILPRNPDTGGAKLEELFVWSCPLCMPVVDALRMYRERGRFLSDKAGRDRFGPGLAEGLRRRLYAGTRTARAMVLEELVASWVRRRFELMRLADDERISWSAAVNARRAQGELLLKGLKAGDYGDDYKTLYGAWPERCPVCEAVGQACGREAPPPAQR
jgi:hypothetical protein